VRNVLIIVSVIGLALTLLPSLLLFFGRISFEIYLRLMLLGTALWFVSAPFWMSKKTNDA